MSAPSAEQVTQALVRALASAWKCYDDLRADLDPRFAWIADTERALLLLQRGVEEVVPGLVAGSAHRTLRQRIPSRAVPEGTAPMPPPVLAPRSAHATRDAANSPITTAAPRLLTDQAQASETSDRTGACSGGKWGLVHEAMAASAGCLTRRAPVRSLWSGSSAAGRAACATFAATPERVVHASAARVAVDQHCRLPVVAKSLYNVRHRQNPHVAQGRGRQEHAV